MCSYSYANYYTLEHSSPETYLASCSSSSRLYTVAHKANIVTTTIKGGIPAAHPSNTANRVTPATAEILTVNEEKRERKKKREKKRRRVSMYEGLEEQLENVHVRVVRVRVRARLRVCVCVYVVRACERVKKPPSDGRYFLNACVGVQ